MKTKNKFIDLILPFNKLNEKFFIQSLMEHLSINSRYSILVKLGFKNNSEFYMSGKQIGVNIGYSHDIKYYKDLYNVLLYRIDLVMENYDQERYPDSVIFSYKSLNISESLVLSSVGDLNLENKSIFVNKDLKKIFSKKYLALTLNESYYGYRVDDFLKLKYINELKSNILKNGGEVPEILENIENKALNVFIDKIKYKNINLTKIIINSSLKNYKNSNEKGYIRWVFDLNTGITLYEVLDLIVDDQVFIRKINNYTIKVKTNKIVEISRLVKLEHIKKNKYKFSSISNTNIGVLDVETFVNSKGLSQVYSIGYSTLLNKDNIQSFYLSDLGSNLNSNYLIIQCINTMLEHKYNNYYWYIHNMGRFDMVFIYKVLEDFNLISKTEHYKLNTIYKDGKMLRLVIKVKKGSNYIKITFLDSLNILPGSLDTLTKDFKVNYLKGYFPYSFVNEYNLNYIGECPDIKYFNSIPLEEYKKIYSVNNWSLKAETIKYMKHDILGLLELLEKFKHYLFIEHDIEMTQGLTISR